MLDVRKHGGLARCWTTKCAPRRDVGNLVFPARSDAPAIGPGGAGDSRAHTRNQMPMAGASNENHGGGAFAKSDVFHLTHPPSKVICRFLRRVLALRGRCWRDQREYHASHCQHHRGGPSLQRDCAITTASKKHQHQHRHLQHFPRRGNGAATPRLPRNRRPHYLTRRSQTSASKCNPHLSSSHALRAG